MIILSPFFWDTLLDCAGSDCSPYDGKFVFLLVNSGLKPHLRKLST